MKTILDRAEKLLEEAEFFLVPISWLHRELEKDTSLKVCSQPQLTEFLRADDRFRLFETPPDDPGSPRPDFIDETEWDDFGITRGPRIMLAQRIPTRKEVVLFLLKKADQTFDTLKRAWDVHPRDNEEIEDQLLQALAKAQRLQRELRQVLAREEAKSGKIEMNLSM